MVLRGATLPSALHSSFCFSLLNLSKFLALRNNNKKEMLEVFDFHVVDMVVFSITFVSKGSPCCCLGWYSFGLFCARNYSVRQNLLQYFFDYLKTVMALPLPGVAHIAQQDIVTDVHPNLRSASLTSMHAEWLSHCPFGSVLPWICLLCCLWSTYQRYVACSKSNDSFLFLWKLQWI